MCKSKYQTILSSLPVESIECKCKKKSKSSTLLRHCPTTQHPWVSQSISEPEFSPSQTP